MWRRLVARYLGVVEAVGSSPVTPTNEINLSNGLNTPFGRFILILNSVLDNFWTTELVLACFLCSEFVVQMEYIYHFIGSFCLDFIESVSVNRQSSKPPIWTHPNKLFEIPKIRINLPSYSDNRI